MKRWVQIACLLTFLASVQAEDEYRDFTDTQGRTIRGRIVSYDDASGDVRFERDNGRTAKVSIKIFSEPDQNYIRQWSVASDFLKASSFKIDIKRMENKNKEKSASSGPTNRKVEDTHYEITLENRTTSDLKNLELEYCIYYEQEEIEQGGQVCNQGIYCGKSAIESVASRDKKIINTDAVSVYKNELNSGWYYGSPQKGSAGIDNVQDGEVHGIWVRVHLKLPSGDKVTREFCYPDSISNSRAWANSSVTAGMN